MGMFQEELNETDKNTTQYMFDEMQDKLNKMQNILNTILDECNTYKKENKELKKQLSKLQKQLVERKTMKKIIENGTKKLAEFFKKHSAPITIFLICIMFYRFFFAWKFGNNGQMPKVDFLIALFALLTTENELVKLIISRKDTISGGLAFIFAFHPIVAIILGFFTNTERISSYLIIYSGFLGLISYFLNIADDTTN